MRTYFAIAVVAAAALCFAAIFSWPYAFYRFTRCAVFAVCCWGVAREAKAESGWVFLFAIVGIVFNPILPLSFKRQTWQIVDTIAGLGILVAGVISNRKKL